MTRRRREEILRDLEYNSAAMKRLREETARDKARMERFDAFAQRHPILRFCGYMGMLVALICEEYAGRTMRTFIRITPLLGSGLVTLWLYRQTRRDPTMLSPGVAAVGCGVLMWACLQGMADIC